MGRPWAAFFFQIFQSAYGDVAVGSGAIWRNPKHLGQFYPVVAGWFRFQRPAAARVPLASRGSVFMSPCQAQGTNLFDRSDDPPETSQPLTPFIGDV